MESSKKQVTSEDLEIVKRHADLANEAFYDFLGRIVTLSAGALTLSITLRQSVGGPHPKALWLLEFSWVGFALAASLGTFYRHSKVTAHQSIVSHYLDPNSSAMATARLSKLYSIMFPLVLLGFVVGMVALLAFAIINI